MRDNFRDILWHGGNNNRRSPCHFDTVVNIFVTLPLRKWLKFTGLIKWSGNNHHLNYPNRSKNGDWKLFWPHDTMWRLKSSWWGYWGQMEVKYGNEKKKSDCSKNATFWFCQSWKDFRDLVQGWQAVCLSTSQQVIRWASAWLTSRKLRPLHLMTSLSSWYDLLILWPVKCEWLSYRVRHGNTILRWLIILKQKNLKRKNCDCFHFASFIF